MSYNTSRDAIESRFAHHMNFFSGALPLPADTPLLSDEERAELRARDEAARIQILEELDAINADGQPTLREPQAADAPLIEVEPLPAYAEGVVPPAEVTAWRILRQPTLTPLDRALFRQRELKAALATATEAERPAVMTDLARARRAFLVEQERATDDTWRARREVDEHRNTDEGRAAYNAARRRVRAAPNKSLAGLSDEEKAAHARERNREKARERQRKRRERLKPE